MEIQCDLCGAVLRGRAKKFRLFAKEQGWSCIEVCGQLVWSCGNCNG